MNNRHSPSSTTIATAPEVPSSTNMNYYDPRNNSTTASNYYPPTANATPVQQQLYLTNDMNSVATAAAAANNSLPPLSHLLPTNNKQQQKAQSTTTNTSSNENTTDYFSPQTPNIERPATTTGHRTSIGGGYPQQVVTVPSQPQYRKSVDYQRAMYPPPPPPPPPSANRRYSTIPPTATDEFYMLSQQQPLSHYAPPAPSTIVPSSADMSLYSVPPHPYASTRGLHHQHYHLPSPPTSVIDGVLVANHYHHNNQHVVNGGITNNSQKVFSFVPLPGLNQKKRPRRKFHEVERLYQCNYQDCTKSYGTLNHLNAHVSMQRHGSKRQPSEFKELRKMWRKQKRDNKQRSGSRSTTNSLDDDEQEDTMNSATTTTNTVAGTILSHQPHHDYMPYMHHPHTSLMSHPPPPPPPPTMWRPHYQHQQPEFMPPPGY